MCHAREYAEGAGVGGARTLGLGERRRAACCAPSHLHPPAQPNTLLNCTQRPSRVGSSSLAPPPSRNPAKIHGLPPTPPCTGCLGNVKLIRGGMMERVWLRTASCGPPTGLSLFRKMICAPRPSYARLASILMNGPGLFWKFVPPNPANADPVVPSACVKP